MKETHHYVIRLDGHLGKAGATAFEGHEVTRLPNGQTTISGQALDQAALFGLLIRVRDMGIPLIGVSRREVTAEEGGTTDEQGAICDERKRRD